jgi:hypothetical protein
MFYLTRISKIESFNQSLILAQKELPFVFTKRKKILPGEGKHEVGIPTRVKKSLGPHHFH